MPLNARTPGCYAAERFDLAIVGGGIYGAMLALEAVRRGLRPVVLERDDFGAATSANSLRIIHGGLRYLQTGDLLRFRESVAERRWFLRTFPDFVEPLPCLMPLYNEGVKRRDVMALALGMNDALGWWRNRGVGPDRHLPRGRIATPSEVAELFARVDRSGLRGGAVWYDAFAPDTSLLLMEVLRWACGEGAVALNYVEAGGIDVEHGRVRGVRATDRVSGEDCVFRADIVINAAGPWSRAFSARCGDERANLFLPTLAWNMVLRREALAPVGLAIQPRRRGGHTYFLVPWKGALLIGTGHAPWERGVEQPRPNAQQLRTFLADINEAIPGLDLEMSEIARVFAGVLPCAKPGTARLTKRPVFVNHGARGGPSGLYSVCGIKLTTARHVADAVLGRAFSAARARPYEDMTRPPRLPGTGDHSFFWLPGAADAPWETDVRTLAGAEPVVHLADILLRRSTLGDNPERAIGVAAKVGKLLGWPDERIAAEVAALGRALGEPGDSRHDGDPVGSIPEAFDPSIQR